ncbi:LacI family transcriptional regulator [Pedobacter sp. G11]|uniref:LacI family DNA-binding transcriptional regulator n=1 Tax=Pedobacter sp. G11 TaxID=2482728 RepID=UPI000F5FC43C|nr:LacI family DNA-binding transcriptional regulator [Pedobacter sp. G11]AZI26368.1 LacI family transcriptional regulator [Pedobacter sp. G11]
MKISENRPVTLKMLATKLQMSVSAISKALNNYPSINPETKIRVREMATQMSYKPNTSAANFRVSRTGIIGVILPDLMDHFFGKSFFGLEKTAAEHGYHIIVSQTLDDLETEIKSAETLFNRRVDGLIVAISKNTQRFDHLKRFEQMGIPLIYFARNPSFNPDCHKVLVNTFQGSFYATEFLIKRGHRNIAFLCGPQMITFTHDRFNGYITALRQNELFFSGDLVAYTDFDQLSTEDAVKKLFSNRQNQPTALLAFKEPVLIDALKQLSIIDPSLPQAIECISFGNTPLTKCLPSPPIATVEENAEAVGRQAVNLLLKIINKQINMHDYQRLIIDCQLVSL